MPTVLVRAGVLLAASALVACKTSSTPAPAPTPRATAVAPAAAGFAPQLIARGDSVFHASSCTECHGQRAKGTPHGPNLTSGQFAQIDGSYEEIVKIITTGVPEKQIVDPTFPEPMPARGGNTPPLSDEQIRALASYVYSLSHR